ncbi:hypothetical protein PF008_g27247 [Phytophthora fragariae]|uniref:Uncharacterized protein n=2 Tax=Phytophthora TaxID=4783 RepID=A0A6G0QEV5_9STRA|nr:hypothetical protein PF008_g27247 [Phytophthora fragariae]
MATNSTSSSSEWPLLTSTLVVCRECLPGALPHVARSIDGYLDSFARGDALVRACRRGSSLRALEYLAARESDPCREDVARAAARSGRVEVLRWFLELSDRRGATDKWHVMDWTASRGHLEATQWLWANRAEVCTSLAVIGAARNGRLEMLQWLEQNVPVDDCVWERAIFHAARYGHLQVVQWLYPKQSDRRSGELRLALSFAARRGHDDVVHWLHSQRTLSSHVCSGIYR